MRYFLDRSLTVRRQRRIDANRSAFSATGTAYDVSFQDMQPDRQEMTPGQIGKVYDVYVDDPNANILAGDEVIIGSKTYSVRGKEVTDFGGTQFIGLVCVLKDV